jgi:hypothetical protein
MKIQNQSLINVEGDELISAESKINEKNVVKLFHLLSNIYKNPIGSIVREYASNAWDANKEVKNDSKAIIVKIQSEENNSFIEFEDFGPGLTTDRLYNVFKDYLSSTKEDTNDLIGGFGLGSKSFFSYTDSFKIITYVDNVEYIYLYAKNSNGIPDITLLSTSPSNRENGTIIKGLIKNLSDAEEFKKETKNQLKYFPNLILVINDELYSDYKLLETEDFIINTSYTKQLELCLGNVKYNIDYNEISELAKYAHLSVSLKFKIGELQPTPNREDLLYSEESKKIIISKFNKVKEYLINKYKESIPVFTYKTFKDISDWDFYNNNTSAKIILETDYHLGISAITNIIYAPINNIEKEIQTYFSHYINRYNIIFDIKLLNKKYSEAKFSTISYSKNMLDSFLYIDDTKLLDLARKKSTPFGKFYNDEIYKVSYIIKKSKPLLSRYIKKLNLKEIDKKYWRKLISIYQNHQDSLLNTYTKITDLYNNIPEKYFEEKSEVDKNNFSTYIFKNKYSDTLKYSYSELITTIRNNSNKTILITHNLDFYNFLKLLIPSTTTIYSKFILIKIPQKQKKYLMENKNDILPNIFLLDMDNNFVLSSANFLKNIVTAEYINKLADDLSIDYCLRNITKNVLNNIDPELVSDLEKIENFVKNWKIPSFTEAQNQMYNEIKNHFIQSGYFNIIIDTVYKVNTQINKLLYINSLDNASSYTDFKKLHLNYLSFYKFNGYKIDSRNYLNLDIKDRLFYKSAILKVSKNKRTLFNKNSIKISGYNNFIKKLETEAEDPAQLKLFIN